MRKIIRNLVVLSDEAYNQKFTALFSGGCMFSKWSLSTIMVSVVSLILAFQNCSEFNSHHDSFTSEEIKESDPAVTISSVGIEGLPAPIIMRDLKRLRGQKGDDLHYNHPSYRAHNGEASPDMRILLKNCNTVDSNGSIDYMDENICFTVFRPEANEKPLFDSYIYEVDRMYSPPFKINKREMAIEVSESEKKSAWKSHICQANPRNPYPCTFAGENENSPEVTGDCYDLEIVNFARNEQENLGRGTYLTSKSVTVKVAVPKTANAYVADVEVHPGGRHSDWLPFDGFPEMNFTRDGKLFVGRFDKAKLHDGEWKFKTESGAINTTSDHTMLYGKAPQACDVETWGDVDNNVVQAIRPLAAAYYDSRINKSNGRRKALYGFAQYPFQDSEGHTLAETDILHGNYPWVDWNGSNIIFHHFTGGKDGLCTTYGCQNQETDARYHAKAINPGEIESTDDAWRNVTGTQSGTSVAGLWTHGKVVVLDGALNNADYGVGARISDLGNTSIVFENLYRNQSVEVNATNGSVLNQADWRNDKRDYWVKSGVRFASIQNSFNYYKHMIPKTPRDVVWYISRGYTTDEVAFDDFIDTNVYIFSEMNATLKNDDTDATRHNDGFDIENNSWVFDPSKIRIQNAATSPLFPHRPAYGEVLGNGRIEPVALGGVRGKGFWMSGWNKVRFNIQDADQLADKNYYIGMFVDARRELTDNVYDVLFSLPTPAGNVGDTGGEDLYFAINRDTQTLDVYTYNITEGVIESVLHSIGLPDIFQTKKWFHVGLFLHQNANNFDLYLDGNFIDNRSINIEHRLRIENGYLTVGGATSTVNFNDNGQSKQYKPLRGWIDEFRVMAYPIGGLYQVKNELACNYAQGSAVGLSNSSSPLWDEAQKFSSSFARYRNSSETNYEAYLCWKDYTKDYGIDLNKMPAATVSLRDKITFPEGPIRFAHSRPNSVNNKFCISCHIGTNLDSHRPFTLSLDALVFNSNIFTENDRRRQPMQPPLNFAGNNDEDSLHMWNWNRSCAHGVWPSGTVQNFANPNISYPPQNLFLDSTCANFDKWILGD